MDLAGDAGVVGRLLVAGPSQKRKKGGLSNDGEESQKTVNDALAPPIRAEHEVRFDLKGRLYRATIVPSSSTLLVVNVQADAARLEAASRCFVKLDPEVAPGDEGEEDGEAGDRGGSGIGFEFDDDEDPWSMNVPKANAGGGEGEEGKAGGAAGAAGKKRKKKATSSLYGGGGGGGGKPKAKAKPKKKRK